MKKLLFATAAIAALGVAAPQAGAQSNAELAHPEIYMQRDANDSYRLYGPDFPDEGQQVLYEGGVRPGNCPEGAWFIEENTTTGEMDQISGCDTTDVGYDFEPMPGEMTAASGESFGQVGDTGRYEDTFLVTPRAD